MLPIEQWGMERGAMHHRVGLSSGRPSSRGSSLRRAVLVGLLLLTVLGVSAPRAASQQSPVVPTQWIAKQFTEVLGRAPAPAEWNSWSAYYDTNGCTTSSLRAKSRELLLGSEFASRYPSSQKGARIIALVRAVYNHDPNTADWSALYEPYANGTATWAQTVDAVYNIVWAAWVVPGICSPANPGYGFPYSTPLDVKQLTGGGASRSQAELQAQLNAAAASCGTVALQPHETIFIGNNALLQVPDCVRLTTAGNPGVRSYARQGRLVGVGNQCVGFVCLGTPVVSLGTGAELRNVWVDATATAALSKNSAVQLYGSTTGDPGVVDNVRVTNPGANGTGIHALGFGVTGQACQAATIANNVVTGYARAHALDRAATAQWADGISVHCEDALVSGNDIVDVGDWGIGLFGARNRTAGAATQRSQVRQNRVLSAGTPASVAIGIDPAGLCAPDRGGLPVPCIDLGQERSFAGAVVEDNTFWTGSRTSFDVGLMVGGKTLWGDHGSYGRGVVVRNNTTGGATARANVGIAVSGMYDTTLTGNTATYSLVDSIGDATGDLAGCPQVNVGDTRPFLTSFTPGSQSSTTTGLYGCLLAPSPTGGLERVHTSTAGNGTFVGESTNRTFTPWGHNYGPAEGLMDDDWTNPATFAAIVSDFRELKQMGTNTLRIHPQLNKFMLDPTTPNPAVFDRLERLAIVAEKLGLYLDITGLGAWRKTDNNLPDTDPAPDADDWLSSPDEELRWHAQEIWWEEAARRLKDRTSVLYYNLMNEMVAINTDGWCTHDFAGTGLCFVQSITLDLAGRSQADVYRTWIIRMRAAIERGDPTPPPIASNLLFNNAAITGDLDDATMVHAYARFDDPTTSIDEGAQDIAAIKAKKVPGKPMVLEEFFYSLGGNGDTGCPVGDGACVKNVHQAGLERTMHESRPEANGWIGHATGHTLAQGHPNFMFAWWMELFHRQGPLMAPCGACQPY
jgi:Cellulase (glycosyl hydrolase family 5)